MHGYGECHLSVPYTVANTATLLCRGEARRNGYPDLSGIPSTTNLSLFSAESQEEAWRVNAIVQDDWTRAGKPHMDTGIQHTFDYIRAYKRMITEQETRNEA